MHIPLKLSMICLLFVFTVSAQAEKVYIWKDQNGVVNFGDHPETATTKEIELNTNQPVDQDMLDRNKKRDLLLKDQSEKEQQLGKDELKVQEQNTEVERKCAEAKKTHSGYMKAQFLYEKNADGTRALVPTERREQALTEVQQYIEKWCK